MRVKEVLKQKGMTAKELAAKIGISDGALSQSIKEGANPNLQTIKKIATALGVSVSELFATPDSSSGVTLRCPHCGKPIRVSVE